MARVAEGIQETARILDVAPVVVGGIAVLCRLTTPHRATDDVDVVDRLLDGSQLEILRAAPHSEEMVPPDVRLHIEHWRIKQRHQSLRSIRSTGAIDIELDDLDLVAELLMEAIDRR